LGAIIRGFKGAVSKQIGKSIWQRNYYESIINDKQAFENISKYIRNNPAKWG
jgi:REP element-mobilizing transposase RayT